MVKKLNPSFVEYFAGYLKKLLADKKKNNETISAEMFQEQVTNAANVYLNENYGADPSAARAAIAQSTPEAECAKAIKARDAYGIEPNIRISDYKTQTEISNVDPGIGAAELEKAKNKYKFTANNEQGIVVTDWTTKTNMLLYDKNTGKKRQLPVFLEPKSAINCGKCWICNTDVMSYTGVSTGTYARDAIAESKQESGTTPCGDCEHVSAIMASYIAGMLTSSGFAKVYWASYYVACVECNRRKSNYIGVNLNATKGWQVDDSGVNAIVDAIFPINGVDQHASEYNPIRNALSDKYNGMTLDEKKEFRRKVSKNIKDGTQTWCWAANKKMGNMTEKTKHIKMSFNVSKIIVAITGHLNVITGPLQKRANKAVKAGRTPVKPKLSKIRGGGEDSDGDDDMVGKEKPDTGDTQDTMVDGESSDDEDGTQESKIVNVMPLKTVVNPPILNWYNLIGEAEIDDETNDEDDEEDDRETDPSFNARILKYRDVIVEYIGNTYSRLLFNQYESDKKIFEKLMDNLSKSMYDILNDSTDKVLTELHDGTLYDLVNKFAGTEVKVAGLKLAEVPSTVFGIPSTPSTSATQLKTGSALINSESQGIGYVETPATTSLGARLVSDGSQNESQEGVFIVGDVSKKRYRSSSGSTAVTDEKATSSGSNAVDDKDAQDPKRQAKRTNLEQDLVTDSDGGGSRLNKHHSKNRTKRVSYIKHKQTRKNHHSRKTK